MSTERDRFLSAVGAVALIAVLAACSGDGGAGTTTTTAPGDAAPGTTTDGSLGCVETVIVGASPNKADFSATAAIAVTSDDGRTHTAYLADFDLDRPADGGTPDVPEGGTMFTVTIGTFGGTDDSQEGIAAGDEISHVDDPGMLTFQVSATDGDLRSAEPVDAEGRLWVTAVGDTLCGEISYRDDASTLTGTFEAPTS